MGVKPVSINKAYIRGGSVLSKDARQYKKRLLIAMAATSGLSDALKAFKKEFIKTKHQLDVSITILVPRPIYMTNKGYISRKGGDIDNFLKLTTDILFCPKLVGHKFPKLDHYDILNINIDDQYIARLDSKKVPSDEGWGIQLEANITPLKELPVKEPQFHGRFDESLYD